MKRLSTEEIGDLRARHKKERDGRIRDRIKAVLLHDKGWTTAKIAEALMIDESSVRRHLDDYESDNKLKPSNGGSQSKLMDDQATKLIQHLESHVYVAVKDICCYVLSKFEVSYTVAGMTSWLRAHGFTYKEPKKVPVKADPNRQKAFIDFYEKLMKETPEDEPIEFGDAVHPTMATKVVRGWIRKGQNKLISAAASRTRINLLGSLNLATMTVTAHAYETINHQALENHFKALKERYPNARTIHLILDQSRYNTCLETKKAAQRYGVKIHYLPPYSPNLNPIERLWKVMNEHVRNNVFFTSAKEFRERIMDFFKVIWPRIALSMTDRINDSFSIIHPASSF